MKRLLLLLFIGTTWGCSNNFYSQKERWSAHSPQAGEFAGYGEFGAQITELKMKTPELDIADKKVVRTRQKVAGFPVEGTWFQEIANKDGEIESYSFHMVEGVPDSVLQVAVQMRENQAELVALARGDHSILKKSPKIESVEVVIEPDEFSPQAWLKVIFVAPKEDRLMTFWLNAAGRVKRTESWAHEFTDGVGFVYHSSPVDSDLSEEMLKDLLGNGKLASKHLSVESVIQPTPVSEDNIFKIATDEREFDLLQSYFFVDQTINWFQDQLNVVLGYPLNIKVHIGGNKPTNAAFFYAGNIRLGEGDGKAYQKIPRDPTIVTHEASHAFVEKLSGLSFDGEAGSYSEAFSDFFTAARLGRTDMGYFSYLKAPFKRNIDNDRRADRDLKGKKYNDSLVISSTFWEIKKLLGTEKATQLAKAFLIELGPGGKIQDLPEVLTSVARQLLPSEDHHAVESVLEQKGWRNL